MFNRLGDSAAGERAGAMVAQKLKTIAAQAAALNDLLNRVDGAHGLVATTSRFIIDPLKKRS